MPAQAEMIKESFFKAGLLSSLMLVASCELIPVSESVPESAVAAPAMSCECPSIESIEDKAGPIVASPSAPNSLSMGPCPAVPATVVAASAVAPAPAAIDDLLIIGRVEFVAFENHPMLHKARIDTGAGLSSLNAQDLKKFERDGEPWVRFAVLNPETKEEVYYERPIKRHVRIKQLSGVPQRRPVVSMNMQLGSIEDQIDLTLSDRTGYLYQVLIGRNFLRDRVLVDVSRKFMSKQ